MKALSILRNKYVSLPKQVRTSMWILICSFMQRGISVVTTPIFTRLLSTDEYGAYSSFDSWMSIITVFVTLNMSAGVYLQGLIRFDDDKNVFSSSLQGLTLTLSVMWTAIYLMFRNLINPVLSITTVQGLAMLVMMWATAVFNFWIAEKRVALDYRKLVIVTIIVSLAKPIVGIVFVAIANDKVTARILGLALVELIFYTGCFYTQMRNGKHFFSKKYWVYALTFSIPLIPHYLSQTALNSADRIMINKLIGSSEAGIYNLAYSISRLVALFSSALLATLSPWLYQKIKTKEWHRISTISYATIAIIAMLNMIVIVFAPEVLRIFGPKAYQDAVWVIPPIAMSNMFTFSYNLFAAFEFYYKKTSFISFASSVGAILNILLNYIFIPIFGYYAAGYTTLFCYMTYTFIHYAFMKYICRKKLDNAYVYNTKMVLGFMGLFTVVGCLLVFTYNFTLLRYTILALILFVGLLNKNRIMNLLAELKAK